MKKQPIIITTVTLVPHADPRRMIDLMSQLVLEEILKQETAAKEAVP